MSKHTSGQWIAVSRMVESANNNEPDICTTNPQMFGQGHLPRNMEEQLANARLIAAAPELLEALKATLIELEDAGYGGSPLGLALPSYGVTTARAAILKATGGDK